MKNLIYIFLLIVISLNAQKKVDFLVRPYLQDAEPTSIKILWETTEGDESIVEWGPTYKLGKNTSGIAYKVNYGSSKIHEAQLTGLKRFTEYYYRVRTENAVSDIFQFKTPPFAEDKESFNMLAMSDMQNDRNYPGKFGEIVNEGIIPYLKAQYGEEIQQNLAVVLIPGDLVENGSKYYQWKDHFFNPAEKLFAEVPVYPVLGNHERNSLYYFKYFSLPENGDPAYAEHWWYKDYGNIRIIGLNSNEGYEDLREQREWLQQVLEETAKNEAIDFVFAQLHHPHKSELWLPGERESTGKVVKMLEEFTTKTGKPSLHFFGHTHAYSRGQSRDHKHLWINVATAGGAIDNWGEYESRDYDEFTFSDDDYGFVIVEVDHNDQNPKMTIKRVSRGNEGQLKNNIRTDSITVFKKERKPNKPQAISPINDDKVDVTGALLKASEFTSGFEGAFHAASHWQVSKEANFEKLVLDSWKQHENWYYKENRQKDDDLTDEKTRRLEPNTQYFWKVRYRDQNLNWSDWSETKTFKTYTK